MITAHSACSLAVDTAESGVASPPASCMHVQHFSAHQHSRPWHPEGRAGTSQVYLTFRVYGLGPCTCEDDGDLALHASHQVLHTCQQPILQDRDLSAWRGQGVQGCKSDSRGVPCSTAALIKPSSSCHAQKARVL